MTEREIFLAALEIEDPARRIVYVNQACGTDLNLRTAVVTLLNAHAQTSQFLETPAASEAATIDQTVVTHNVQHDDHTDAEREAGEAAFRRYLEPATRPGWIGRLAHYEIEAILGSGAFGIVAKAFDEKLHRVVAIKLMNPGLATTSPPRKRFLREARTAAAVTHENLVAIHAVEEEPIPYLVMEYVPGQTLQQRMNAQGPLELKELLRIGQQVAAGLAAAHATNLIHRDIKPANILLTGGPNERAKISDFGLARAVDDASMTSSGMIAGTPLYMAPEQARGEPLDHRADLFSLGSVLYQMASGRPPFRAANTIAVLKRVCEDTPRPLADVIPEIPGWLDTIIFKLLEKNRDDRYQTAQEVADLLARCQRELEHTGHVTAVPQKEPLPVVGSSNAQATKEPKSPQTKPEVTKNRSVAFGIVLAFCAVLFVTVLAPRIGRWFQVTIPPLPQTQNIGGLRFDGKDDYVEVTGLDWNYPQFTIEAFVTSDPASDNGTIAFLGSGANDDEEWLSLYDGGPADAGKRISGAAVHGKDGFQNAYGPFSGGVRQHRALVCSERMIDYYINGVWQGQRRAEPHEGGQWKMKELRLGCDGNGRKFFQGVIDELRISRVARYTQSFDLIASVIEDDLTLALYRPREGQGAVMKDLSGNGHDGNIVGASWVKTKAPSPSTSSETDPTLVQRQQSAERQLMDWLFANQGAVIVATPGQAIARQPDPNNPRFMEPGVRHHKKDDLPSDSASLLGVFSGKLTDSQVQFIGDCRQLEHIMAWASPLTNEALAPIVALPKLRSLSLAHTKITAEGIPTLIRAAGLVQLDLGALPLTDDSLIELARLEKLEYLSLWGSQVTDDGLNRLSGLKSLRTLVLNRTRVTEKGAESLQRALPECLILTDDNSTGTPWYGWPFDAPKPAIAPFDAAQARKHQEQWAVYLKVPVEYTNSLGMKFHLIPPGEFMMGSTAGEIAAALGDAVDNQQWQGYINSEAPQHKVILTQPIYLGVNEVTQAEFEKVIGVNPSYFAPIGMGKEAVAGLETTDHPVDSVSWNDAAEFCAKLSQQEKLKPFYFRARETITPLDGTGYRLPSEAEWEFACRAGTATKYWIGDKDEDLGRAGWFGGNSGGRTHAAGELKANPFGLSDIHGNVYEWVQDGWDASYYGQFLEKPAINPNIPILAGSLCVIRGGFWFNSAPRSRSSVRVGRDPTLRHETIGFRVLLPVDAVRQAISTSTVKNSSPTPAETAGTAEGNYSIRLAPGAHVEVPSLTFDPAAPYTLEAWVTPLDASHADKHVAGWTGPCSLFVSRAERNWSFGLSRTGGPYQFLASPTAAVIDRRVHLAAVRTGREFRLYLDGQRVGNSQEHPSPLIQPRVPFSLSSPRQPFAGDYDEVRVSRVARYDENFTPKLRLEPDADTLALYHCDENGGEQLVDASSHKHHGKIVGPAKWIGSGKAAAIADAPKPAIAPFDAAAARAHQEVWAKHLGVPVEYTNSIGMKFRLIPPGEFLMGSTPEEVESTMKAVAPDDMLYREAVKTETPRHKVVLTKALYLGVHEVTQKQYQEIMGTNPSAFGGADIDNRRVKDAATIAVLSEGTDTANFPVDSLSWNDAAEFCAKLSQKEQFKTSYFRAGNSVTMLEGNGYRLPTEAEWEFACRAGTTTRYWSGDKDADLRSIAWFGPNAGKQSHTVGELKPNPFGLYDMHGNLWEWVQDWWEPGYYEQFTEKPATDPLGAPVSAMNRRGVRGGYWRGNSASCRASYRNAYAASTRDHVLGFRVSLVVESVRGKQPVLEKNAAPARAIAPFDAAQAKAHQEAWAIHLGVPVETTNSIGAKMILIPPGEFPMGAPETDTDATPQEKPQHRVTLTKPFAIGATEVTNRQFRKFVDATKYVTQAESDGQGAFEINPKVRRSTNTWDSPEMRKKSGDEHPVRCVSWEDARRFCEWLSNAEGQTYRLPTEAEWEFACRAGTTTRYSFGDNFSDSPSPPGSSGAPLRAVAQLPANPFGLFDMHGSVNEFCLDSGRTYTTDAVTDPLGSLAIELPAAVRGGAISSNAARQRSSNRYLNDARRFPETNFATTVLGFRVVRDFSTAPPIAKAPFDARQARAHQEAWAAHLKVPVESTNSVGMKLRLIPPGEFLMGSTDEQVAAALKNATEAKAMQVALDRIQLAERPQHRVVISRPFHFGATEVTNAEFRKFVEATQYVTDAEKFGFGDDGETQSSDKVKEEQKKLTWRTPGYPVTDELPVTQVSWNDAQAYCHWLSMQEQAVYRMPTEAEWEYACRAGTTTHYSFGDDVPALEQFGWYVGNTHGKPEAAGAKPANGFGLHDMHGNLFEWCQDIFDETWYQRSPNVDPPGPATGPASGTYYVVRGGFWGGSAPLCRSAFRINHTAAYRHRSGGFRVVREVLSPPVPAKAPFDAAQARLHQEQWAAFLQLPVEYVNRHGMKFRLIPPGEFSMGSSPAEVDAALAGIPEDDLHWKEVVRSEAPQHTVVLTRPFYLGLTEVTQAQYQKLIGTNPAYFSAQGEGKAAVAGLQTDQHPVERVTVQQIKAFCERFNESESLTTLATVPSDTTGISTVGGYRLPTEAEWEFACRAGTTTKYWSGESVADLERVGWIDSNSDRRPHPVGTLPANPFGLFDVHGNVWEWVADGGKSDSNRRTGLEREVDPFHPPLSGGEQLIRGGVTYLTPEYCRSASRHAFNPTIAYKDVGFRLAISIEGVRKSLAAQPQSANSPSDDR